MKKIVCIIFTMFLISVVAMAETINVPPVDPKCKSDETATCTQICTSTLIGCGPYATWVDGKFVVTPYTDCNTATCSWNCYCIKTIK